MNRDEGLKLVTFVLSIVCAVLAAAFFHHAAGKTLKRNEHALQAERTAQFDESVDGRLLIDKWKLAKTAEEQHRLWMEWTQLKLNEEPWWFSAKNEDIHPVFEFEKLLEDPKELERLKSEGWLTMDGERLYLTPEQVWYLMHNMKIYRLKDLVDSSRLRFWLASPAGAILGFYCVWIVYLIASRIAPDFHKEK